MKFDIVRLVIAREAHRDFIICAALEIGHALSLFDDETPRMKCGSVLDIRTEVHEQVFLLVWIVLQDDRGDLGRIFLADRDLRDAPDIRIQVLDSMFFLAALEGIALNPIQPRLLRSEIRQFMK